MKEGQFAAVPSLTDLWFVRSPQGGPSGIGPAKAYEPVRFPVRKLVSQVPDGGNPQSVNFWSAPLAIDESRAVPQPLPAAREFIDSQIYFLGGSWQGSAYFWWPMSFAPLSVVIYGAFTIPQHPTWTQDVQPVMAKYMRLYPGMRDILDMANYDVVRQNAQALQKVFSLAITDPGRMPVTRDLAPVKMQMVLDWIAAGLPI